MSKARAPVIYLYPEQKTEVNVKLVLNGKLTTTYPLYDNDLGWNVTATPEGIITDSKGREYSYLFWEGDIAITPDLSSGFCIRGEDTAAFLEKSLKQLGLTDIEADAFIMYWLPLMEESKYNVITFQTAAYEDVSGLKNLADCFVHVTSINTTFYIDDKHRTTITWAGPIEANNYDFESNPLKVRSQFVIDFAQNVMMYYDATGAARFITIEDPNFNNNQQPLG